MVLMVVRLGRLDWVAAWAMAKESQEKSRKPRGATRTESTKVRWFSWWSSGEAGLHGQQPKTAKGKQICDFRQPRGKLNRQTDSLTGRDNLLFFRG